MPWVITPGARSSNCCSPVPSRWQGSGGSCQNTTSGAVRWAVGVCDPGPAVAGKRRGADGREGGGGGATGGIPPARLVLVWQLSHEWQYDPKLETQVEVTFDAVSAGSTR